MMMPPPMMYPMPPQQGFWARWSSSILITLATSIFGLSLLLNFWLLIAFAARSGSSSSDFGAVSEEVLRAGNANERVVVLKFKSVILDQSAKQFIDLVHRTRNDKQTKAVVIEVDSPGGSVTASDELYDAILDMKKELGVPVYVSLGSIAASGGYYMSMAADEVYAQRTTLTGSIGVILSRYDLTGLGDKYGIKDGSIVSDGATFKNAGTMWKPLSPEEDSYFKSVINDSFAIFKSVVTTGRGNRLKGNIDDIANGKIYSAQQALALGLVDGANENLDDVIDKVAAKAGLTKPNVVHLKRDPGLFELLSGQGASSRTGSSGQVNLQQFDTKAVVELLHELNTPRLMYVWPG